ncbi:MAG: SufS family cysteine desulfurase [Candidatus Nealsonbacteria bacterium]|nr:SufS family cysteine desulfurase [Candidatus Nealsonbacteria bacterium]
MFSVNKIKKDFPVFKNHPKLVYLDSAATSLKPRGVIVKLVEYYEKYPANVFRGIYKISEKATEELEETRKIVADFIGAKTPKEVIFTRNTTESINLVSYALGEKILRKGDEVALSIAEHHSNFVPWQQLAKKNGAVFKIIDVNEDGKLIIKKGFFSRKTKILALTYVSNVLGTINPIKEIIKLAKSENPGIITVIDAAQAIPHLKIDVKKLGADFLAFSSHKMLGPTGLGILWGKEKILQEMKPFNFGGEMVEEVSIKKTTFKEPPLKFEAGTPDIAGIIALKEAIRYLSKIGFKNIRRHEIEITRYAMERMLKEFGERIKIFGPKDPRDRGGIISFALSGLHPHDVAQILDEKNICVRAGHHCAIPLHKRLGVPATTRASFYIYNDKKDIDKLILGLKKAWILFTKK